MDRKAFICRLASEDGQVWSWVLKIFIVFAVLAIIITQFVPIIHNQITTRTTASDAAEHAVQVYERSNGDMEEVNAEVNEMLLERDARMDGDVKVVYNQSGSASSLLVSVRKIVNTFLFEHVSYLCQYTEAYAAGEASLYSE